MSKDYSFEIANLTPSVLAALRSGKYPVSDPKAWDQFLEETCNAERVLAVLEYPSIDIELEMWTATGGDVLDATEDDCDVSLSYFVCLKASDGAWYSDEHADKDCEVDFTADDWEAQLEADMSKAAVEHAKQHGFSLTEPND